MTEEEKEVGRPRAAMDVDGTVEEAVEEIGRGGIRF